LKNIKVEKILKGSLDTKYWIVKGKTLLGIVNKLLKGKRLLTPSNVLPLNLKQTFPPII
jgi:hypothetical protein